MLYQRNYIHGGDIYEAPQVLDFSVNINPYGVPESVREAVRTSAARIHQYPDPYCRELVQALAAWEQVPASFLLCGNGAAELIYSFCDAVKPKTAVMPAPTFSEYALGCERMGCEIFDYPLRKENDFCLEEGILDFLEEKRPDVLFLCNPNNPDGRNIPKALLLQILQLCKRHSIRLFLDECFLDLSDHRFSLAAWLADEPELFLLKAFTKNYGIAGVRLGYCMSADADLLEQMAFQVQPWNVSVIAQEAGIAALKETAFIGKARTLIQNERPWLMEQITRFGWYVCPSEANYLLFEAPAGLDKDLLSHGIRIRNCSNFIGLSPHPSEVSLRDEQPSIPQMEWYRISVRQHEDNVELIKALEFCKTQKMVT